MSAPSTVDTVFSEVGYTTRVVGDFNDPDNRTFAAFFKDIVVTADLADEPAYDYPYDLNRQWVYRMRAATNIVVDGTPMSDCSAIGYFASNGTLQLLSDDGKSYRYMTVLFIVVS